MGYVGYPAHIFYMKIFFNRAENHIERLWILEEWFSDLRAYLPLVFEKTPEDYTALIYPRLEKLDSIVDAAWDAYRSQFEDEQTFDPAELEFVRRCKGILRELDEITAISKIIDKQKPGDEEMVF